jgi:hypothetical protein
VSPIGFRDAELRGTLEPEPLEALAWRGLRELLGGHEFLLTIDAMIVDRLRS